MRKFWMCLSVLALALGARAASVDDVLDMSKKGEPEDKIIAAVEATPGEINMGASDVLRLREAKISDKVILAILKHSGEKTAAAPVKPIERSVNPPEPTVAEKPPVPVQPTEPTRQPGPPVVAEGGTVPADGRLSIDNLDDRPWSYMYEPAVQTIWISSGGAEGRGMVRPHGNVTLSMKAGTYKVRFLGSQDEGAALTIYGGEKSGINLTHVIVEGSDSLYATVFERGERKGNTKLAALDKQPVPAAQQDVVVQRPVVEQPIYYSDPPVYYYSGPSYYYYGRPYYYRPYYGSGFNFSFGYSSGSFRGHRR